MLLLLMPNHQRFTGYDIVLDETIHKKQFVYYIEREKNNSDSKQNNYVNIITCTILRNCADNVITMEDQNRGILEFSSAKINFELQELY